MLLAKLPVVNCGPWELYEQRRHSHNHKNHHQWSGNTLLDRCFNIHKLSTFIVSACTHITWSSQKALKSLWMPVDTPVDACGHLWVPVDTPGHLWTPLCLSFHSAAVTSIPIKSSLGKEMFILTYSSWSQLSLWEVTAVGVWEGRSHHIHSRIERNGCVSA